MTTWEKVSFCWDNFANLWQYYSNKKPHGCIWTPVWATQWHSQTCPEATALIPWLCHSGLRSRALCSIFSARTLPCIATVIFPSSLTSLPVIDTKDIAHLRRPGDNSFDFMLGLCSDVHCQLWDLYKMHPSSILNVFKTKTIFMGRCMEKWFESTLEQSGKSEYFRCTVH